MNAADDCKRELLKFAQLAGMEDNAGVMQTIEMLDIMPAALRARTVERLVRFLGPLAAARGGENHPFLPNPPHLEGELALGSAGQHPIGIRLRDMLTHLLIVGPTGKGKSRLILNLLAQLVRLHIPIQVFDTKGEYADLLPALCPETRVISFADMRRNVFSGPAAVTATDWIIDLMPNFFRESFYYRDGVINLFRDICGSLIVTGTPLNASTFVQAFERARPKNKSFRNIDYYESLKRFIATISRPTYWCESGFDLEALSRLPVVYNLANTANDLRLFFIADIVTWLQAARQYRRGRGVELVLVFDELSNFITEEAAKRSDIGEPFILEMVRRSRAKGIPVIIADQTYTTFHSTIRTNCQTKIVFQTSDGPSLGQIASDFCLSQEQRNFLRAMSFESRRVLAQLPTWPEPVLVDIPDFEVPSALPTPADSFEWVPIREPAKQESRAVPVTEPTHEMERYLAVCANYWWMYETEHDKKLELNPAKANRIRQNLIRLGLLQEHKLVTGLKQPPLKLAVPTKAGYEHLDRRKMVYEIPHGNGTIQHRWWQRTIALWLEARGYTVKIEGGFKNKRVDVAAVSAREKVAFEVVISDPLDKEVTNFEKDIAEGWDRVAFCVQDEEVREKLNAQLNLAEGDDRAEIRLLKTFL